MMVTRTRYAGVKILFKPPQIASVSEAGNVKREVFIGIFPSSKTVITGAVNWAGQSNDASKVRKVKTLQRWTMPTTLLQDFSYRFSLSCLRSPVFLQLDRTSRRFASRRKEGCRHGDGKGVTNDQREEKNHREFRWQRDDRHERRGKMALGMNNVRKKFQLSPSSESCPPIGGRRPSCQQELSDQQKRWHRFEEEEEEKQQTHELYSFSISPPPSLSSSPSLLYPLPLSFILPLPPSCPPLPSPSSP
eukprot:756685-Hanusia_phi.AAC.2